MTDPNPALAELLRAGAREMRERADKLDADAAVISGRGMSTDTARLAETAARAALGSYFNEDRGRTQSLGLSVTAAIAAAIRAARQAALDEAAQIAERHYRAEGHRNGKIVPVLMETFVHKDCPMAAAIRSLMAPKGEGE